MFDIFRLLITSDALGHLSEMPALRPLQVFSWLFLTVTFIIRTVFRIVTVPFHGLEGALLSNVSTTKSSTGGPWLKTT